MIDLEAIRKRNKELREDNWFPLSAISDWDWSPSPCDDIDALIAEVERLTDAALAFVDRVDELTPHIMGDRQFAAVHGIEWRTGDWVKERAALLEAILKRKQEAVKIDVRPVVETDKP